MSPTYALSRRWSKWSRSGSGPHILVNNAGNHLKKPAVETTDDEFAAVLQTHLFGTFALTRGMRPAHDRAAPRRDRDDRLDDLPLRHPLGLGLRRREIAVAGLTRLLATEFSPHGVRINAVAPGWFDTALNRQAFAGDPGRLQKILSRTPLGRVGEPVDVGYAAVYLCSAAAKFVTGVVLPVDGGAREVGF